MSDHSAQIDKIRKLVADQSHPEWKAKVKQELKALERSVPQESLAKLKAGSAVSALGSGNMKEFAVELAAVEIALDQSH